jgi:gliding motility-associated-like protein
MALYFKHSIKLLFLLLSTIASAQYILVDDTYTAQQLADVLVANSCSQVSNVTVTGSSEATSYSYFNAAASDFPFTNGVLLSTGFTAAAPGPNRNRDLSQGSDSWRGDGDLESALGTNSTFNATVLEFDFLPLTSSISFDYMLASEEYLEVVDDISYCDYSDGFAFLLKPAGSTDPYQNLAVIPNTSTPVQVTTVRAGGMCPEANAEYFGGYNQVENATGFNGQTIVLTAQGDVTPGVLYHIKLVIADQGDTYYDSAIFLGGGSFNFSIDLGPDRVLAQNNPVCSDENPNLTAMTGANDYKWYKDDVLQAGSGNVFTSTGTGTYKVEATYDTCVYTGDVLLEYAAPINHAPVTFTQCDDNNDGLTAYYLTQITQELFTDPALPLFGYYSSAVDAANNNNPIADTAPFYNTARNQIIYAKLQNAYGCQVAVPVTLAVTGLSLPPLPAYELCSDASGVNGFTSFNLTEKATEILLGYHAGTTLAYYASVANALVMQSPIAGAYTNSTAGSQTIYVRLDSPQGCYGLLPLTLVVRTFTGDFNDAEAILCNDTPITLDAGAGNNSYTWQVLPAPVEGRFLTVTEAGAYTVKITNALGCEAFKTYNVTQSGAVGAARFDINDFSGNANSITATVTQGNGVYQYSIDGTNYQDSPVFTNVDAGMQTIYIKDVNGCGPLFQKVLYVLDYPRMFSPNGDNINDTWFIPYMYSRPNITATVFDRYGRLITGFTGVSSGWDGTFNGQPLPASDYWFIIQLENGSTVKGHFSLIR